LRGNYVLPPVAFFRAVFGLLRLQPGPGMHRVTVVVGVVLVVVAARRLPLALTLYAGATVAVAIAAENLGSLERYVWGAVVPVLALADISGRPRVWRGVLGASVVLIGVFAYLAFTGNTVP
jgi:hypothetical protein